MVARDSAAPVSARCLFPCSLFPHVSYCVTGLFCVGFAYTSPNSSAGRVDYLFDDVPSVVLLVLGEREIKQPYCSPLLVCV
jgi:hypothetical protein